MTMGTLYIDRKDLHIKLDGQALAFYANGKREGLVPINPLKRVIVIGHVLIETPVLHRLAQEHVSVLFLSGKRLRFCGLLRGRLHNNGMLRVKQYEKSLSPFMDRFSREIVKNKIVRQKEFLLSVREARPDLRFPMTDAATVLENILETIGDSTPGMEQVRGYEGGASAAYFQAYTKIFADSLNFRKRTRRPPEDPVNAMLSLCYTLIHFEVVREIEVIGLDPTIGFLHQFEYGRESLACDLVELFRTEVDRFVWNIFRERAFTARDFSLNDERPGCYLKKESRQRFYPCYEEWAKAVRPDIVKEVRALAVRLMDGQDIISE